MKACSKCGVERPHSEFYRRDNGYRRECKKCFKAAAAARGKLPKARAYRAAYQRTETGAAAQRRARLKALYGITPEEYEQILEFQGGVCYICQRPPKEGGRRLHVDHDHKTGLTRGLLCVWCNVALGKFRDDWERIQRAAQYIQSPPVTQALGLEVYGRKGRVNKKKRRARKARRSDT